jgi:hypothetical protein
MAWLESREAKRVRENQLKFDGLRIALREAQKDGRETVFFCGGWLLVEVAEKILKEMGGDG